MYPRKPPKLSIHELKTLRHLLELRIDALVMIGTDAAIRSAKQLGHTRGKIILAIGDR
jgi:hypothetical protein